MSSSCERLVAQDGKGGERDGNLDDDRADRQEPDFALGLCVHRLPNARGHGSTYWGKTPVSPGRSFPGASRRPAWQSLQKSTIIHTYIYVDFKEQILPITHFLNSIRKM